jgi:phosphoglycerate dehydrogenase-like enzyme
MDVNFACQVFFASFRINIYSHTAKECIDLPRIISKLLCIDDISIQDHISMVLAVHLLQSFDNEWIAQLKSALDPDITLTHGSQLPSPADFSILISGRPEKEHLVASQHLRTLIIPWAGLPEPTRKLMLDHPDIAIHNIHHNSAPAAETAVALMMAAARKTIPIDRSLRTHDWTPRYTYDGPVPGGPLLLSGKTALILGYGAIGQKIASACRGLSMKVLGIKNDIPGYSDGSVEIYSMDALPNLLPRANVLFVCLPLTPETKGIIGRQQLDLLPDEAIIVNIARGPIIDEKALYTALKSPDQKTRLRAGLDVWYNYPKDKDVRANTPPSKYPFHELDNVVMSPHLGGHSDATEKLRIAELADMLNTAAKGEPLPNPVDPHRGY